MAQGSPIHGQRRYSEGNFIMPYSSMEDVNPAIKGIDPKVTLAQANKIAEMADAMSRADDGPENPWAAAIAQFKRMYEKTDSGWKKKDKSENVRANVVDKVYRKRWDGKEWLVVPTIMIKEGVLNGELVPKEEIAKFPSAWNKVPLVMGHPRSGEVAVSANDPGVLDQYAIGQIFGAECDGDALKAEAWIDLARARKVKGGNDLINMVLAGKPIEVSTGYYREREDRTGEWKGQKFEGVARNLRPDHLAALLDTVGACSWKGGCGMPRVNDCGNEEGLLLSPVSELLYSAPEKGDAEGLSGKELEMESDSVQNRSALSRAIGVVLEALGFTDPEDVQALAKSKGDMAKDIWDRLEMNAEEMDAGLEGLSSSTLQALVKALQVPSKEKDMPEEEPEEEPMPQEANVPEQEEKVLEQETEEPQENQEPCADKRIEALERTVAQLTDRLEAAIPVVQQHQEAQASEKAKLVKQLAANANSVFAQEELEQMDVPLLQKLARSLMPKSYLGQEGGPANNEVDDRPLVPWNRRTVVKEK